MGLIRQLEGVQRLFTWKFEGLEQLNYWERLSALNLYSLERRRERYLVIYVWKMIRGLVTNEYEGREIIQTYINSRRGLYCRIPELARASSAIQTMKENSFLVTGPKLFNCMPKNIRDHQGSLSSFKRQLDKFLKEIPDKPSLPHYYQEAAGNSVIDQLSVMRTNN